MRFVCVILAIVFVFGACHKKTKTEGINTDLILNTATANGTSDKNQGPKIQFDKTEHDFGIIMQGEKVSYTFKYKNIGNADLIIKDATASCGCTVPHYSKEPIAPGETGEIEVIFNSENRTGRQTKTITVWSNCQPNQSFLKIYIDIATDIPNN